jgi:hypothetical protein
LGVAAGTSAESEGTSDSAAERHARCCLEHRAKARQTAELTAKLTAKELTWVLWLLQHKNKEHKNNSQAA